MAGGRSGVTGVVVVMVVVMVCVLLPRMRTMVRAEDDGKRRVHSGSETLHKRAANASSPPAAKDPGSQSPSRATEDLKSKKGFTDKEQAELVFRHNDVRRTKGSSNMNRLRWSSELAELAQDWAQMCKDGRRPLQQRKTKTFDKVGENYFASTYYGGVKDLIGSWLEQKAQYIYSNNTCAVYCDDYKQMVWWNTSHLGCGFSYCSNAVDKGGYSMVCNYGPMGLVPGVQPYLIGEPCSLCEASHPVCRNKLCEKAAKSPSPVMTSSLCCRGSARWWLLWLMLWLIL